MRRLLFLSAAVAAVAAIAAVWLAPATLVAAHVVQMTGGMLRLDRAEGTVWRASGILVAGAAAIPVAWRVEPWPLLRGEVRLHVRPDADASAGSPRADIAIVGERVAVRDAEISFPASVFAALSGTAVAWAAGGEVNVSADAVDWAPPANHGAVRVLWRGARLSLPAVNASVDLGDMTMALAADGDRLSGPVSNDGGDLAVRGEITLRASDAVQVSLTLAPRRADDVRLNRVLAAIATADGSGWRLGWRVPLR